MIPSVIVPIAHEEILNALKGLLHNNNSKIEEFEEEFSAYIGCDHSIATYRGITALYALLKSYRLKREMKSLYLHTHVRPWRGCL